MITITHLYDTYPEAERVVGKLEAAGIPHSDISIVGRNETATGAPVGTTSTGTASTGTASTGTTTTGTTMEAHSGAGAGAGLGTLIGGGAGLLAGIGALAIPGVGPVVAAGWLIATITGAGAGATAGGLLGSLTGAGVPERDAHVYAEGVRRGGTLVSVRTSEAKTSEVNAILFGSGAADLASRRADYERTGWTTHDPAGAPYDAEQDRSRTL